jgi:hypothetical protein
LDIAVFYFTFYSGDKKNNAWNGNTQEGMEKTMQTSLRIAGIPVGKGNGKWINAVAVIFLRPKGQIIC